MADSQRHFSFLLRRMIDKRAAQGAGKVADGEPCTAATVGCNLASSQYDGVEGENKESSLPSVSVLAEILSPKGSYLSPSIEIRLT